MNITDDKKLQRDAMPFPFRWYDALLELPDGELRAMLAAMRDYATKQGVPNFTGALAALWREIANRIEYDRRKFLATCERNRQNGEKGGQYGKMGGRPRKNPEKPRKTPTGDLKTPKTPDGEGEGEGEGIKETMLTHGKENASASASLFSFSGHEDGICQSSIQPGPNFKKWSSEQFTRSVDDAITEHPEYAPHRETFIRYWTEPDGKGRPRKLSPLYLLFCA